MAAYALYRGIRGSAPSFVAWDDRGPWVAGGALAAAGLYQLTPLKAACLRHCREGEELVADELVVEDGEVAFSYRGVCGYGSTFDYAG